MQLRGRSVSRHCHKEFFISSFLFLVSNLQRRPGTAASSAASPAPPPSSVRIAAALAPAFHSAPQRFETLTIACLSQDPVLLYPCALFSRLCTEEFGSMVKDILRTYYMSMMQQFPGYKWDPRAETCGPWLPKKIVIFRNGVSDAEFRDVLDLEIRQLLPVFREVFEEQREYHPEFHSVMKDAGGWQPQLTVVAAMKNHGTRLFPAEGGGRAAPLENVPPGTVVDSEITSRHERNFFLVSHSAIPGGTVRPTYYRVLLDDMDVPADVLETFCFLCALAALCFPQTLRACVSCENEGPERLCVFFTCLWRLSRSLCHAYCRATKSVSIVAPVYMATLAMRRGRIHAPDNSGRCGGQGLLPFTCLATPPP